MTSDNSRFMTGDPRGTETVLGQSSVYTAQPAQGTPKAAVILVHDVFGWNYKASRLYADALAEESGFMSVLPDLFNKDDLPNLSDRSAFTEWKKRNPADKKVSDINLIIAQLKDQGVDKFGTIGFCWGGLAAVILAGTDLVSAAVINHGSGVTKDLVEAVIKPVQFNCAENDRAMPPDQVDEFRAILEAKHLGDCKIYEGQKHGWTTRPDADDPAAIASAEEAFHRAKDFLMEHLS